MWIIGIYLHSFTKNEREIFNNEISFIVSELVQVIPENSLAECVNL